jgi:hypothetical protein
VQGKEHTQIKKRIKLEIRNKNKILSLQKIKRAYLGFIPLDLTKMVVYLENENLFE